MKFCIRKKRHRSTVLALLLVPALISCSFAPSFIRPDVSLEESWVGVALDAQQHNSYLAHEIGWRDYFRDRQLQQFIGEALEHNHDLRIAALNVELAQAQYRITHSAVLPVFTASGAATRSGTAEDLSYTGKAETGSVYNVGLGIAAFELDFFGKVKNQGKAMLNSYLQTIEARDAAQLSIISAVAKTYYLMRTSRELMELAKNVEEVRKKSYELTKLQVEAGTVTEATLQGILSAIELAKADYEERSRSWLQSRNTLSLLVGRPLSDIELEEPADFAEQFPRQELFASLPAEVLLYRPDIRQAEYALKAENANIGVARAAFFPSITLTSSMGYGSRELGNLFGSGNWLWSFSPRIDLPIFDYGRRKANVKAMEIRQKIAVEKYANAVQNAFVDINNALIARSTLERQFTAIKKSDAAIAERLRLIQMQLHEGVVDGLALLDAERQSFTSRQGVLAMRQMVLCNCVDLYIAMGGGLLEVRVPTSLF